MSNTLRHSRRQSQNHMGNRRLIARPVSARPACEPLEDRRLFAAAANDAFTVGAGGSVVIPDAVLLGNDTDVGSILSNTEPANGTLTRQDGQFVYTPRPGFSGTDSFTYAGRGFTEAGVGATLYIGGGDLNGDGAGVGVAGGEVMVNSYSWSIDSDAALPTKAGDDPSAGRTVVGGFDFSVPSGGASPGLLSAVADGRTVDRLTLIQRVAGAGRTVELIRYTLSDARFLAYIHDDDPSAPAAAETFSVSFAAIDVRVSRTPGTAPTSDVNLDVALGRGGRLRHLPAAGQLPRC